MMALIVALVAFSMSVVFFGITFEFPHLAADPGGPALYPRIVAVVTGFACALYGVQHLVTRKPVSPSKGRRGTAADWWSAAIADKTKIFSFALVILLPAAIDVVGFAGATFLFVIILMMISGVNLVRSMITAVLSSAGVYAGYAWVLGAVLPKGFLFE
ncbi:tripartite tricarboxylate transporter TctB family protein [Shumkonia mesophila]|uniref:tripartite tricarboxylate transporter TctB family protein n=1 Tax=Shumkonia mesophila TaxID=2838854 RepID=UPI0029345648|nr:tripartite tricarboxylate transporter TctB family protein [Shumkonia mesophila]